MDRERAIVVASKWVEQRYPVVPSVAGAFQFTDDMFTEQVMALNSDIDEQEVRAHMGKWFVAFFCSWDTDARGMPQRLCVLVDDNTEEVELAVH